MQITKLDHVNIRTTRLDVMINWYTEVLGMSIGYRPDFSFAGAWMYAGDNSPVHLIKIDGEQGIGSEAKLKLEHFAFSASGGKEFEGKLSKRNESYKKIDIPSIGLYQINLWDPDGNHIHVDFPINE